MSLKKTQHFRKRDTNLDYEAGVSKSGVRYPKLRSTSARSDRSRLQFRQLMTKTQFELRCIFTVPYRHIRAHAWQCPERHVWFGFTVVWTRRTG